MNGIERITRRLNADTDAEIRSVLEAAEREAEEITAAYAVRAEREAEELTAKSEREAAEREGRLVSAAELEARKAILSAKQEIVERTYTRVLEKLRSLSGSPYRDVLAELMLQASPKGTGEVIFAPRDHAAGKAAIAEANRRCGGALTISPQTRDIDGGFLLKDGKIEVDCTFGTLVARKKIATASMVAEWLFG